MFEAYLNGIMSKKLFCYVQFHHVIPIMIKDYNWLFVMFNFINKARDICSHFTLIHF